MTKNTPEQRALDRQHAATTQAEANDAWDDLERLGVVAKRKGDAPFAEPERPSRQEMLDGLCPQHKAEHISAHVLSVFTDACPDVKMSYDDWMTLEHFIELGILDALGVDIRPDDDSSEPVTVQ